jgi:antitoxin YefM
MQTIQASDFQEHLQQLSTLVIQRHETVRIVSKQAGNMVIMSEQDYNSLQETLYLLSNPRNAERLREARQEPLDQAIAWKNIKAGLKI